VDLLTYLAQASPEEWHQVAWNWNRDNGQDVLRWIIRQSTCDRGTTLLVYWGGAPRYFAQYAAREEVPHTRSGGDPARHLDHLGCSAGRSDRSSRRNSR
jgi:Domain of unknown function (DUF4274)